MEDGTGLINKAKKGDTEAFREIVEANSRNVFALAFRLVGNEHEADDVVQETFLRAWRQLERFDGRSALSTWLFRIASNCAYDLLRSRSRRARGEIESDSDRMEAVAETQPGPGRQAYSRQVREQINVELNSLTQQERTAFVLRHLQDFSIKEVSQVLGTGVNTTKQAVFRAVRKLRAALEPAVRSL